MAKKKQKDMQTLVLITIVVLFAGLAVFSITKNLTSSEPTTEGVASFDLTDQPMLGDPNAPVTIVEFGDIKCPACKEWERMIYPQLKADFIDTGKVKMHFLNYPFIGQDSYTAAIAGESIYRQSEEAFWQYYEAIYENQGSEKETWATIDRILEITEENVQGVDLAKLEEDVINENYMEEVNEDKTQAAQAGISSTPSIFINGKNIEAAFDYEAIKSAINDELDGGK